MPDTPQVRCFRLSSHYVPRSVGRRFPRGASFALLRFLRFPSACSSLTRFAAASLGVGSCGTCLSLSVNASWGFLAQRGPVFGSFCAKRSASKMGYTACLTFLNAGGGVAVSALEKFVFGRSLLEPAAGSYDKLLEAFLAEAKRRRPECGESGGDNNESKSLSISLPSPFFSDEDAPLGCVPQPQQRLSCESSRAVVILRVASLLHSKSKVHPELLLAVCRLIKQFHDERVPFRLPRASVDFVDCPAALTELLRLVLESRVPDKERRFSFSFSEAAYFLSGSAEVAGRLYVCARVGAALRPFQVLNSAASVECLLLPRDGLEDCQSRLASTPCVSGAWQEFLSLLHDAKLQQHRRKSEECRSELTSLCDQLAASALFTFPVEGLLQFVTAEAKREQVAPRGTSVSLLCGASLSSEAPNAKSCLFMRVLKEAQEVALPALSSCCHPARGLSSTFVDSALAALASLCSVTEALLSNAKELLAQTPRKLEALGLQEKDLKFPLTVPDQLSASVETQPVRRLTQAGLKAALSIHRRVVASYEELRASCVGVACDRGMSFVSRVEDCCLLLQQATGLQTAVLMITLEQQDALQLVETMAKVKRGKKATTVKWPITAGVRSFVELVRRAANENFSSEQEEKQEEKEENCEDDEARYVQALVRLFSSPSACVRLGEEALALLAGSNCVRRVPKAPKGTQDFEPDRMVARSAVLEKIKEVFHAHGGLEIDTPVFELRETLLGKYGEDSKLVYDLKDQGGEQLSLRYDLTVPFARYMASHNLQKMRRYHIGKVYRRDEPQMNKGRFREFYQCDFDIAGEAPSMMPDAECLCMLVQVLLSLKSVVGNFKIKVNHRGLLDAIMQTAELGTDKFTAACAAIDKLDKEPWSKVREEMVDEKHIPPGVADTIGKYVKRAGTLDEMLHDLSVEATLRANGAEEVASQMSLLAEYVRALEVDSYLCWDWSLARGLDYYTGIIFEAVMLSGEDGSPSPSIAGGGRYDKLVGIFSAKDVPAVGFSVGVERLFALMEARMATCGGENAPSSGEESASAESLSRKDFTDILVCHVGVGMVPSVLAVCRQLWDAGFACEFFQGDGTRLKKQLDFASTRSIPWVVICGEAERERGTVKVKQLTFKALTGAEGSASGGLDEEVPVKELTRYLRERINASSLERYRKQLLE